MKKVFLSPQMRKLSLKGRICSQISLSLARVFVLNGSTVWSKSYCILSVYLTSRVTESRIWRNVQWITDFKSTFFIPSGSLLNKPSITFQKAVSAKQELSDNCQQNLSKEYLKGSISILHTWFCYHRLHSKKFSFPTLSYTHKRLWKPPRESYLRFSLENHHHNLASMHLSEVMAGNIKRRQR